MSKVLLGLTVGLLLGGGAGMLIGVLITRRPDPPPPASPAAPTRPKEVEEMAEAFAAALRANDDDKLVADMLKAMEPAWAAEFGPMFEKELRASLDARRKSRGKIASVEVVRWQRAGEAAHRLYLLEHREKGGMVWMMIFVKRDGGWELGSVAWGAEYWQGAFQAD